MNTDLKDLMIDICGGREILKRSEFYRRGTVRKAFRDRALTPTTLSVSYLSGCVLDAVTNEIVTSAEYKLRADERGEEALYFPTLLEASKEGHHILDRFEAMPKWSFPVEQKRDEWVRMRMWVTKFLRPYGVLRSLTKYADDQLADNSKQCVGTERVLMVDLLCVIDFVIAKLRCENHHLTRGF
jgi:hypothetical protein